MRKYANPPSSIEDAANQALLHDTLRKVTYHFTVTVVSKRKCRAVRGALSAIELTGFRDEVWNVKSKQTERRPHMPRTSVLHRLVEYETECHCRAQIKSAISEHVNHNRREIRIGAHRNPLSHHLTACRKRCSS